MPPIDVRVRRGGLGLLLVGAVVLAVILLTRPSSRSPAPVYWGAEIGPQFTGTPAPWDMTALADFEARVGHAPAIVAFNLPFEDCTSGCRDESLPMTQLSELRAHGSIPMLNWSSQSSPISVTQPAFRLAAVAEGSFDSYIRAFAEEVKAWGHPMFLRFDWEMNETWFPWGATVNGNRPGEFVAAWRHVHAIFDAVGATDVSWVWCPYAQAHPSAAQLRALYPGDDEVDWTCLDGYNFGQAAGQPWRSFASVIGPSYDAITRDVAPGKPMMMGEVASSESGGSKPDWIGAMLSAIPHAFPRIRGVVWFDATNTADAGRDGSLPLESSAASLHAFGAGVGGRGYAGNRFGAISGSPIAPPVRPASG